MNIAGVLASFIFAMTVLTVLGGMFAYAVRVARDRRPSIRDRSEEALCYFVEHARVPRLDGESRGASALDPATGPAPDPVTDQVTDRQSTAPTDGRAGCERSQSTTR